MNTALDSCFRCTYSPFRDYIVEGLAEHRTRRDLFFKCKTKQRQLILESSEYLHHHWMSHCHSHQSPDEGCMEKVASCEEIKTRRSLYSQTEVLGQHHQGFQHLSEKIILKPQYHAKDPYFKYRENTISNNIKSMEYNFGTTNVRN